MDSISYANGSYRTGAGKRSLPGKLFPAAVLYSRLFSIVVRGSSKAKHGRYATPDWSEEGHQQDRERLWLSPHWLKDPEPPKQHSLFREET